MKSEKCSNRELNSGIFVIGTGTDVGKTFVSALLVKELRKNRVQAGYYKAALSGAIEEDGRLIPGDADYVCKIAGLNCNPEDLVSYIYRTPVSPAFAAELEGNPADLSVIEAHFHKLCRSFDFLVVEGSGGIVCPIRRGEVNIQLTDVIQKLNLATVLVADAGLGTLNNIVLTVEYVLSRGIQICGVILNHYDASNFLHIDNRQSIEQLAGIPVVGCVCNGEFSDDTDLSACIKIVNRSLEN